MVKRNILVTGAAGQLGKCLKSLVDNNNYFNFCFKNKTELDISNFLKIENFLNTNNIDLIINCAAYTNVEKSELDKKKADLVNHLSLENLANLCCQKNIQLIQISTDFVFDGIKMLPYNEKDKTNPVNFYGVSKLRGENKILKYNLSKSIIIRTSWLYSKYKGNFVAKVIDRITKNENLKIVDDEFGSPTNALDLAKDILKIIPKLKNNNTEIYHYSNRGYCSRFEFACMIKKLLKANNTIHPVSKIQSKVNRPRFSSLDSNKIIKAFKLDIKDWSISLESFIKDYKMILNEI